jgi:hypothetical protein
MQKSAEVVSNDPKEPVVQLVISGAVDKFATITPRMVSLRGTAGETLMQTVTITPESKYPFKIVGAEARDGKNISFRLNEVKGADPNAYALVVQNLRTDAGSFNDIVVLRTDNLIKPELDVRVYVYLRPQPPAEKKTN